MARSTCASQSSGRRPAAPGPETVRQLTCFRPHENGSGARGYFFFDEVLFLLFDSVEERLREEDFLEPEPPFFPPPSCRFTVAQARRSDSFLETPRLS
jgi:hypothetical protein